MVTVHVQLTKFAAKDIYTIDYSARHRVEIAGVAIGSLAFKEPAGKFDKLIDLRGKRHLKNDYKKITE